MKKNIDTYKFDGDWGFNLRLPEFSKIYSEYWFRNRRSDDHQQILEKGYVPMHICDERTYDPDPTKPQETAINYLLENEESLVTSIFEMFKHQINKKYVERCGEDDWIPEMNTSDDFGKLARINSVQILTHTKDQQAYVSIDFEYRGDEEHGIAVVIHKNNLIGFAGIGDMGYGCIYQDLGLDESKVFEEMGEQRHIGVGEVHQRLSKYGKFKPWQLTATSDYFGKLLREKKNQVFIKEVESNEWDISLRFSELGKNLIDKAAYSNNVDMLDYLINRGGDYSNSILQCINYGYYHEESIKYLVEKGASIDTYGSWGTSPLCNEIENVARIIVRKEGYRYKDQRRFEKAMEDYEMHKRKIRFYLSLGANPHQLDKEGSTYKDIVKKSWAEHVLRKYHVLKQVEELIFPRQHKSNKWKFWKK